jgi:hypothetical protein
MQNGEARGDHGRYISQLAMGVERCIHTTAADVMNAGLAIALGIRRGHGREGNAKFNRVSLNGRSNRFKPCSVGVRISRRGPYLGRLAARTTVSKTVNEGSSPSRFAISYRKLIGEASDCSSDHGEFDSHPVLHEEGAGGMVCHQS